MDAQFWINAWNEGRTNFHQGKFHPKLLTFFPRFAARPGQKVLVPLCGKAKDLLWLHGQGLEVHGYELYQKVVEEFFADNQLGPAKIANAGDYTSYAIERLTLFSGDFLKLRAGEAFDFIYDRASLVALPKDMRDAYAAVITRALKVGGKYLLVVYEYDQTQLEGPPFSIDANEVHALFQDHFEITLVESERPANEGRLGVITNLREKIYALEKRK